jgi:hypothetical protein
MKLAQIFEIPKWLSHFSSTGKMRALRPVVIFTLQNGTHFGQGGDVNSVLHLVIYLFWYKALLDKAFSSDMHCFTLEIVFHLMFEGHSSIMRMENQCRLMLTEKKTEADSDVTIAKLPKEMDDSDNFGANIRSRMLSRGPWARSCWVTH